MSNENLYILVSEGLDGKWIRKDAGPITRWLKSPGVIEKGQRWMSEHFAPGRWIAEQVSPEYSEQMDVLREVHEQVENWTKDLSNALDRAQDARKLGKPLDAIFWLGQINNRLKLVSNEKNKLEEIQERHLEKYFEEHEENIPDDYFETGEHKIVEAGVLDDLGRQVTTWKFQKAHKLRLREQDLALKNLLGKAKTAVGRTYSSLREMSKALGSGDVSKYLLALQDVSKEQGKFETEFRSIYDKYFASMVARIKSKKQEEATRSSKIKEEADQREKERLEKSPSLIEEPEETPESSIPVTFGPETAPSAPSVPPTLEPVPTTVPATPIGVPASPPPAPPAVEVKKPFIFQEDPNKREEEWRKLTRYKGMPEENAPETVPNTVRSVPPPPPPPPPPPRAKGKKKASELDEMIIKMNHSKFQQELEKSAAAGADSYLLAAMMLKYSEMIDQVDPQKSMELLSIAEGILNG